MKLRILFLLTSLFALRSLNVEAQMESIFVLNGYILNQENQLEGAVIRVYENGNLVDSTRSRATGKFYLKLPFLHKYEIIFGYKNLASKKIRFSTVMPTNLPANKCRMNMVVTLNSKNASNEPIANYAYTPKNGGFIDFELQTETDLTAQNVAQQNAKLKSNIQQQIANSTPEEKQKLSARFDTIMANMNRLLTGARTEANSLLNNAKVIRQLTLQEINSRQRALELDALPVTTNQIYTELAIFDVDQKKFMSRPEIQKTQHKLEATLKKSILSLSDSMDFASNRIYIREELLKSAQYQLEIDRLSARSHEDSLLISEKEEMLKRVAHEIDVAKTKLQLQQTEIRIKNIVLISFVIGLTLAIVLLFLFISKNRIKTKMNTQLAQVNTELELRNKEIARQNHNIMSSINYAKNIQQTILPLSFKTNLIHDLFILFRPKDIVSGDFFWFWETNHENTKRLYAAVVDCTGHGVPGAFMSLIGNRLLNEIVKVHEVTQPAEILRLLDQEIVKALRQQETQNRDGMDIGLCMIEMVAGSERKLSYSGAKRPLLYLKPGDTDVQEIKGSKKSIGGIWSKDLAQFEQTDIMLPEGTCIYLSSDGFVDQCAPNRKKFGSSQLFKILPQIADQPMDSQMELLENRMNVHQDTAEQRDDITLMGLRL
ncbi:MAG: hypothetical protein RIS47_1920 [Bacteroidota bacterium]|jgi:serine phosphatase RsbU (regulator of sigma subunit)